MTHFEEMALGEKWTKAEYEAWRARYSEVYNDVDALRLAQQADELKELYFRAIDRPAAKGETR
jgi:hypothetical protein